MENRFNYLLTTFIFLLLAGPLLAILNLNWHLDALVFLVAIILTLKQDLISQTRFYLKVSLAVLAFVITILSDQHGTGMLSNKFGILANIIYIVFIYSAVVILTRRLVLEKNVNADTIKGGICLYFLIGFLWSLIYNIVYVIAPTSFKFSTTNVIDYSHFHYYSFTVLTTLGFGDITPISLLARNLTTLEAITGQMFLAIFVARLISLYTRQTRT